MDAKAKEVSQLWTSSPLALKFATYDLALS